ncbi:MAG TPA: hypothetical protein VMF30_02090, partial [Pirellulales bacterium]|nr:hypothetical protein [Pirellulales bacterium]
LGELGLEGDCLFETFGSFARMALLAKNHAEIVENRGVVRPERKNPSACFGCFSQPSSLIRRFGQSHQRLELGGRARSRTGRCHPWIDLPRLHFIADAICRGGSEKRVRRRFVPRQDLSGQSQLLK